MDKILTKQTSIYLGNKGCFDIAFHIDESFPVKKVFEEIEEIVF